MPNHAAQQVRTQGQVPRPDFQSSHTMTLGKHLEGGTHLSTSLAPMVGEFWLGRVLPQNRWLLFCKQPRHCPSRIMCSIYFWTVQRESASVPCRQKIHKNSAVRRHGALLLPGAERRGGGAALLHPAGQHRWLGSQRSPHLQRQGHSLQLSESPVSNLRFGEHLLSRI